MIDPSIFPVNFFQDLSGQGNSSAAGRILFFGMMDFSYPDLVVRMRGHQRGQTFVDLKEDIDPHAEIAGIQECPIILPADLPDRFQFVEPTGRAGYHGYASLQATYDIVEGTIRPGEFNG